MSLSPEQVRFFRHCGFVKLPDRLPAERVEQVKALVWQQIRDEVEPVVKDRTGRTVRISSIWDRDPLFRETVAAPEVLDSLESLLGPRIELITNRHNHACLRLAEDGTDYLHRDILQWSRAIVTVIFYLEETTIENGCTWIVPGTHFLWPGLDALPLARNEEVVRSGILDQAVPVPMPAGGMLAIDSLVFHGVGPNRTEGSRMSLTVGYHSADEISDVENPKRVLVRGGRRYLGNDY